MSWVKLDDSFFSHPKVVNAGTEAIGLYVLGLTYSSHHLTDGHVPSAWVRQAVGSKAKKLTETLMEHGLWELNGTGWLIHDYLEYQASREQIQAQRAEVSAARSEAGKRGAASKWGKAS